MIHTVGPVWHGGQRGEDRLLAACYAQSLRLAGQHGVERIAFPCISTGVYGYPADLAAKIAVDTVRTALEQPGRIREVIFCCFSLADLTRYDALLSSGPE